MTDSHRLLRAAGLVQHWILGGREEIGTRNICELRDELFRGIVLLDVALRSALALGHDLFSSLRFRLPLSAYFRLSNRLSDGTGSQSNPAV